MKFIDLTGKKFNRLTVIRRAYDKDKHPAWLCKCDCGNETVVLGTYLKNGRIKSCGCFRKEYLKEKMNEMNKSLGKETHGQTESRLYNIWCGMKCRCENKNYEHYGKRGISVCDEWKNSFISFRDWAMQNGYTENLTIDRVDVNGNYCPENCRWVTQKEQMSNTTRNIKVTINGITKCVAEWCEEYGILQTTVYQRVTNFGWNYHDAIITPTRKKRMITIDGVTKSEKDWCAEKGMSRRLFRYRIHNLGLSEQEAILRPVNPKHQNRRKVNQ